MNILNIISKYNLLSFLANISNNYIYQIINQLINLKKDQLITYKDIIYNILYEIIYIIDIPKKLLLYISDINNEKWLWLYYIYIIKQHYHINDINYLIQLFHKNINNDHCIIIYLHIIGNILLINNSKILFNQYINILDNKKINNIKKYYIIYQYLLEFYNKYHLYYHIIKNIVLKSINILPLYSKYILLRLNKCNWQIQTINIINNQNYHKIYFYNNDSIYTIYYNNNDILTLIIRDITGKYIWNIKLLSNFINNIKNKHKIIKINSIQNNHHILTTNTNNDLLLYIYKYIKNNYQNIIINNNIISLKDNNNIIDLNHQNNNLNINNKLLNKSNHNQEKNILKNKLNH